MLNKVLNTPLVEECKWQDTSIFNIEAVLLTSLFKVGIKFSRKIPYGK